MKVHCKTLQRIIEITTLHNDFKRLSENKCKFNKLFYYIELYYNQFMLNTIIIQPPLVQLNTPYPSGAYLSSFFKTVYKDYKIQGTVKWLDLSTELFHEIFCRNGLSLIFEKSKKKALKLADNLESQGDDNSAFQLRRYVSQSKNWCNWIDSIVAIVCGSHNLSGREFTHEFVRSAHAPRGARMENYLSKLTRDVGVDDSQILASLALADLADYITAAYDENFALIRYAERLATSEVSFSETMKGLDSPVLTDFYKPLLLRNISDLQGQNLFCISVPFPGTFTAALQSAGEIKALYGENCTVAFGGGYINTELRNVSEQRLFEFCDFLSYDKGYGSYLKLLEEYSKSETGIKNLLDGSQIYNVKYCLDGKIIQPLERDEELENAERQFVKNLIPDFSDIDFSRSPRLADDANPMHRIWNDGAWLKTYMAYGCYWHRCAFCDTSLDYVKNFCSVNQKSYFEGIYNQAQNKGVYGIHFVDEACPPVGLQQFALQNLTASKTMPKLTFWGNVRFEKTFSRDLADLLSYGGLTAVSAGIEIATGDGLDSVNKGIDMENIVSACCAFKEAGILVHSYMIYGFWNQTEQDLINSMETLRQLFAAGLLDSAFWHKFTLTLHSTVYQEWLDGKHQDLQPVPAPKTQFAENDIHWKGENKSQKYADGLNSALELWMHGEKLKKPVESYFQFRMPKPSIPQDFVDKLIEKYEKKRDSAFCEKAASEKKYVWIGGKPVLLKSSGGIQLCWSYMGELLYADVQKEKSCEIIKLLEKIEAENFDSENVSFTGKELNSVLGEKLFKSLRGKGLCALI